jgi:guanine nucleotide-binding protein subunit gamma
MPAFESRGVGDVIQIRTKKQSMADLKLRRLTELNIRLREDLDRPRIKVSEASHGYVSLFVMDPWIYRFQRSPTADMLK